jgi:hypothetical protein
MLVDPGLRDVIYESVIIIIIIMAERVTART